MTAHTYKSGNTVYEFRQPQDLRKAAEAVQAWWVGSDASEKLGGAPACIFMLRAALAAQGAERIRPLSDDDIEAIASHIRPITETGAPSWEHAIARAIERAHGIVS